jgi:hypothetical protein
MVGTHVKAQILSNVVDLVVDLSLDIIDDVVEEADNTVRAVRARRVEKFFADARCVELRERVSIYLSTVEGVLRSKELTVTMA